MFKKVLKLAALAGVGAGVAKVVKDILDADAEENAVIDLDEVKNQEEKKEVEE